MSSNTEPKFDIPSVEGETWIFGYLVRTATVAVRGRVLLLGLLGLLISEFGIVGLDRWFAESSDSLSVLSIETEEWDWLGPSGDSYAGLVTFGKNFFWPLWQDSRNYSTYTVEIAGVCWRVAVWTLFGNAIARLAALNLAGYELPSAWLVVRQSCRSWFGRYCVVLVVFAVALLLKGIPAGIGQLSQSPQLGFFMAMLLPIVYLFAFLAAVLALGLTIGWPLMVACSAAERPDPFDMVSCGFAYVYQRPLRLAAYITQAAVIGIAVGTLATLLVDSAIYFQSAWTTGYFSGDELPSNWDKVEPWQSFWTELFEQASLIVHAAYFWCASVAIYLLMRREIDEKQADEIYLGETTDSP